MPEYELCALNDGVNLLEKVMKILGINEYQIVLDATVVIQQLKKASKEGCGIFKRFVHNRLKNILSKISSDKVFHIPTNLNPSDLGSKPLLVKDQQQLWFFGPKLFQQSWDLSNILLDTPPLPQSEVNECLPGISKRCLLNISSYQNDGMLNDILYKYSKLEKLLRVTFFVKSFIFKISKKLRERKNLENLLFMELYSEENRATTRRCADKQLAYQNTIMNKYSCENRNMVLNFWIRVSQQDHFREEFEILEKGQKIPKSSKLFEINPFIQKSSNLLRVKGRFEYLDTDFDTKYPIILPKKAKLTELIILYAHKKLICSTENAIMNDLRKTYWIFGMKTLIKRVIKKCQQCRIRKSIPLEVPVAPLPSRRVNTSMPFEQLAIDLAGPFITRDEIEQPDSESDNTTHNEMKKAREKEKKELHKRYLMIFSCVFTICTHIEMILNRSTEELIAAIKRVIARRGRILTITCDNEASFSNASRHI